MYSLTVLPQVPLQEKEIIKPMKLMKSDNHFTEVFARLGTFFWGVLGLTQIKAPKTAMNTVQGTTTSKGSFTKMGYKVVEKIRVELFRTVGKETCLIVT